jgi:3-deoxy-D-manno-octulosonate 8-phosphate phosphatase (KDO 8-P phosphatase)
MQAILLHDVMGISLGRKAGLVFALISGEDNALIDRFAAKMGIADVFKGCKDKAPHCVPWRKTRGLDLAEVCFMGDDVNDLPARAGRPLSRPVQCPRPCDRKVMLVTRKPVVRGAVRELVDYVLSNRP